ncbi:Cullin-1 [Acorus gramineus]|uniref:Cullin-1 n=1 Tax=Acorus gramineus TaxID=55184 RepID=A0AAV9BNH3_ACOGR|nr:Cullin-1 [Acorus gramineus]
MEDLSRMYELFSKINKGLEPICEKFEKCITYDGMRIIRQAEDAANQKKDFMNRFIELYDRYMNLIENCFSNHSMFHKALRGAFEVLCNKTVAGNSMSEIICFFVDNILKKGGGSEKLSDTSIDETFDKIVTLLEYVQDKDLFAEFYRKKLARRLINDRSACDDHERSFLTKLKQQFGRQLTSRMEGMITDMTLAREKHSEFSNYLDEHPSEKQRVDFTITVLTTGFWPTNKISDLQIPEEMSNSIEIFERFYMSTTRSRKLIWLFSLGTCIMIGKFDARPIEINLTTYQAVLLLLFNNCDRLSFEEIADQLKLPNHEVNRLLHSLSCSKYKVLNKEPNNKTISARDVFEFNSKFTNKMSRIKIPVPISEEKKKVIKVVDADRSYVQDLCRMLKRSKRE